MVKQTSVEPDPEAHHAYGLPYTDYRETYESLIPLMR